MFGSLYLKVFVNIILKRSETTVYIELFSNKNIIKNIEETFTTKSINEKMLDFILEYTNESPFYYISILDTSSAQGAIPTCSKNQIGIFHDVTSSEHRCFKEKWSYFTSREDLYALEKTYKPIGIDFVFSPFVMLAEFFKDKIDSHLAMFILVEEKYLSLAVFDKSELLFARHMDVQKRRDEEALLVYDEKAEELHSYLDEGIDLEEINPIDELEFLDDFADIADLDALEEIDEFADSQDLEEEFYQDQIQESKGTLSEGFNEDFQRFLLIQSSVKRFYLEDKYKSIFIESVYIADGSGVSQDLKRYLEEEMFLSVYVRKIDLAQQVCELAKAELNS
ncbi:MAG: hypothetical protein A2019_03390 [Sulfurimonas sp. GWF2_37_8]|nr:MAG: hypothetical protein A2019_03390 [Sulfurimonas sp. GWF2_37_8]